MSKLACFKLGVAVLALSVMLAAFVRGLPVSAAPPDPGDLKLGITPTPTSPLPTPVPAATATPEAGVDRADPVITKRGEPSEALPGEEVVFTLEVTNQGKHAAVDVVVTDEMTEYLEIVEVTTTQGIVRIEGQVVIVDVGVLGPDFAVVIVIRTRVRLDAPSPLVLQNVAVLHSPNGGDRASPPVIITIPDTVLLPKTGGVVPTWGTLVALVLPIVVLADYLLRRKRT